MTQVGSTVNLYTIGYGNSSIEDVAKVLKTHDIKVLVDVRSRPYSKYKQEWNRKTLKPSLRKCGIHYLFMGKSLGGKPVVMSCYVRGVIDYRLVREKRFFQEGIKKLLRASEKHAICLLCSEKNPWNCHRMNLIGAYLIDQEVQINHILSDGKILQHPKPEKLPEFDLLEELTDL